MPRFFFNVHDDAVTLDDEGLELPNLEAAMAEAVRGARSLACEEVMGGRLDLRHRVDVADDRGLVVASVSFKDAVEVLGQ